MYSYLSIILAFYFVYLFSSFHVKASKDSTILLGLLQDSSGKTFESLTKTKDLFIEVEKKFPEFKKDLEAFIKELNSEEPVIVKWTSYDRLISKIQDTVLVEYHRKFLKGLFDSEELKQLSTPNPTRPLPIMTEMFKQFLTDIDCMAYREIRDCRNKILRAIGITLACMNFTQDVISRVLGEYKKEEVKSTISDLDRVLKHIVQAIDTKLDSAQLKTIIEDVGFVNQIGYRVYELYFPFINELGKIILPDDVSKLKQLLKNILLTYIQRSVSCFYPKRARVIDVKKDQEQADFKLLLSQTSKLDSKSFPRLVSRLYIIPSMASINIMGPEQVNNIHMHIKLYDTFQMAHKMHQLGEILQDMKKKGVLELVESKSLDKANDRLTNFLLEMHELLKIHKDPIPLELITAIYDDYTSELRTIFQHTMDKLIIKKLEGCSFKPIISYFQEYKVLSLLALLNNPERLYEELKLLEMDVIKNLFDNAGDLAHVIWFSFKTFTYNNLDKTLFDKARLTCIRDNLKHLHIILAKDADLKAIFDVFKTQLRQDSVLAHFLTQETLSFPNIKLADDLIPKLKDLIRYKNAVLGIKAIMHKEDMFVFKLPCQNPPLVVLEKLPDCLNELSPADLKKISLYTDLESNLGVHVKTFIPILPILPDTLATKISNFLKQDTKATVHPKTLSTPVEIIYEIKQFTKSFLPAIRELIHTVNMDTSHSSFTETQEMVKLIKDLLSLEENQVIHKRLIAALVITLGDDKFNMFADLFVTHLVVTDGKTPLSKLLKSIQNKEAKELFKLLLKRGLSLICKLPIAIDNTNVQKVINKVDFDSLSLKKLITDIKEEPIEKIKEKNPKHPKPTNTLPPTPSPTRDEHKDEKSEPHEDSKPMKLITNLSSSTNVFKKDHKEPLEPPKSKQEAEANQPNSQKTKSNLLKPRDDHKSMSTKAQIKRDEPQKSELRFANDNEDINELSRLDQEEIDNVEENSESERQQVTAVSISKLKKPLQRGKIKYVFILKIISVFSIAIAIIIIVILLEKNRIHKKKNSRRKNQGTGFKSSTPSKEKSSNEKETLFQSE